MVLFSMFATASVYSQDVVSTQGDSYSNVNGSIDYTIGEVVINTVSNGSNDLTQGFHQTIWQLVSIEKHVLEYDASLFPNPTEDVLNIRTAEFQDVTFSLYDAQGKLVLQDKLVGDLTSVQVNQIKSGNYSLVLNNKTQKLKTFQIIKTY